MFGDAQRLTDLEVLIRAMNVTLGQLEQTLRGLTRAHQARTEALYVLEARIQRMELPPSERGRRPIPLTLTQRMEEPT